VTHDSSDAQRRDEGRDVVVAPDGRIVVVGRVEVGGESDTLVARFRPNGRPDRSFGGDGIVVTDHSGRGIDDRATAVARQPDGRIAVGGADRPALFSSTLTVLRYRA